MMARFGFLVQFHQERTADNRYRTAKKDISTCSYFRNEPLTTKPWQGTPIQELDEHDRLGIWHLQLWVRRLHCTWQHRAEFKDKSLLQVVEKLKVLTKLNLTRLKTVRERSHNVIKVRKLEDMRINDALDIATSLPDPMAIPMSAAVRACTFPSAIISSMRLYGEI